jgi:hypothetical protein
LVKRLEAKGVQLKKGITDLGVWKYVMVPAPDDILIELFEVDKGKVPAELLGYFD